MAAVERDLTPTGTSRSARQRFSSRRRLSFDERPNAATSSQPHSLPAADPWSDEETKALLEFLLFHKSPGVLWFRRGASNQFWLAGAAFVRERAGAHHLRSESALHFFEGHTPMPVQPPVLHYRDNSTQTYAPCSDVLEQMKTLLAALPEEQALTVGQFMQYIAPPDVNVPPDFIKHALACMNNLTAAGRSNKALGTKRPDGSSRMPVSEMPVGLLEYTASFFSSDSFYQVISCPEDYKLWCESMYCLFGTKWTKIHGGPLWSIEAVTQGQSHSLGT